MFLQLSLSTSAIGMSPCLNTRKHFDERFQTPFLHRDGSENIGTIFPVTVLGTNMQGNQCLFVHSGMQNREAVLVTIHKRHVIQRTQYVSSAYDCIYNPKNSSGEKG